MDLHKFFRNTRLEKHIPLGAPPNPGGSQPITGNAFAGGASGPAVTPALAQGLQGCFGLQYVDVTLSSAQILALFATAVTLVPAPGVGFWICPWMVIMRLIGGSAAYLDGGGGAVSIGAGTMTVALANNNIFLVTVSPNTRKQVIPLYAAAVGVGNTDTAANPPTEDNAALAISKATANFTAGTGTMHISVMYTIETTV